MRTTIDIPDELYRTLKTRAAIRGITLRELVRDLIEQGLDQRASDGTSAPGRAVRRLPVAITAGGPMIDLSPDDIHRIEEEEDLERLARSS